MICRRKARIREQQVGNERMLFDETNDTVHVLNGSAMYIWDCMKDAVSAAQIEALLQEKFDLSRVPDVPAMVAGVLQDFASRNLIETVPAPPLAVQSISREQPSNQCS